MGVKVSGAEFKRFYNDQKYWPPAPADTYHDDVVFMVNGDLLPDDKDPGSVADTDVVAIEGGAVYHSPFYKDGREPSIEAYFRRWKKEQTTTSLVVECDLSKIEAIKAAIKAAGGKVLS